mmetsp:Transcript_61513/g.190509  ORF Transcript_61513/g.190509 Transcript_61513/m.190509 type:complete len:214 (+) Transcript_61513:1467-2108(+)
MIVRQASVPRMTRLAARTAGRRRRGARRPLQPWPLLHPQLPRLPRTMSGARTPPPRMPRSWRRSGPGLPATSLRTCAGECSSTSARSRTSSSASCPTASAQSRRDWRPPPSTPATGRAAARSRRTGTLARPRRPAGPSGSGGTLSRSGASLRSPGGAPCHGQSSLSSCAAWSRSSGSRTGSRRRRSHSGTGCARSSASAASRAGLPSRAPASP